MRLQRITTSSRWIPAIDGLRFVAILSVLLTHVFAETVNRGGFTAVAYSRHPLLIHEMYLLGRGVQVFFVISGFILAQPFLRAYRDKTKPVSLRSFYTRRLTRLEPPYILALLLYAGPMILFRHAPPHLVGLSLLSSILYVHNFLPWLPPIDFVAWSLEVEVMFYLLAPLLALVFLIERPQLRRGILVTVITILALTQWAATNRVGFLFPSQLCYFLIGYLLADLRIHERSAWIDPRWDLVNLFAWPALFFIPDFHSTPIILCALLLACFVASMLGPVTRRLLELRWVALLGGMCYSTYLLHMLIISALFPLSRRLLTGSHLVGGVVLQWVLLLPPVLLGSVAYFLLIERPCMDPRWPHKLLQRLVGLSGGNSFGTPVGPVAGPEEPASLNEPC